jgi:O-succinylbenzoic acid--CoA ligase
MERAKLADLLSRYRSAATTGSASIEEATPEGFMASFANAVSGGGDVFLTNPSWQATERAAFRRLAGAGDSGERGWLMIPSGGAAGGLKFARHDSETIAAAVGGFCGHFGMERVNSVGVLPLHHVSGLMAWMRSAMTGGTYVPWPWKQIEAGRFPPEVPADCCLSLVPTQLQRLIASADAAAWLRKFRVIFIGGGPAWDGLVDEAARLELPLSASYGATETAAMVAAQRPEEFLNGMRGCGSALPHARIDLVDGVVRVAGESVFRGYFPSIGDEKSWVTGDLGVFGNDGSLLILGRGDDLIVTGGKKVSPVEVEAALRSSGEFEDVAVIGVPDPEWGQSVVACHPGGKGTPDMGRVRAALTGLASYKHPKRYAAVSPWLRNAQGKINRLELARLAAAS